MYDEVSDLATSPQLHRVSDFRRRTEVELLAPIFVQGLLATVVVFATAIYVRDGLRASFKNVGRVVGALYIAAGAVVRVVRYLELTSLDGVEPEGTRHTIARCTKPRS